MSFWKDSSWWDFSRSDELVLFFKDGGSVSYNGSPSEEFLQAKSSGREIQALAFLVRRYNAWGCIYQLSEESRLSVSGYKSPERAFEIVKKKIEQRQKK